MHVHENVNSPDVKVLEVWMQVCVGGAELGASWQKQQKFYGDLTLLGTLGRVSCHEDRVSVCHRGRGVSPSWAPPPRSPGRTG